ncbi:hypothetical protein C1646_662458 [Rhizophagus diaphanus]|nr:hypothetical protein C1646_662458 [Rhizophagus diaphanus] [Rhizophagus sp. MUCL 43196]
MYMMNKKESYTQNELKVFEEAIADWCTNFVKLFSSLFTTECSFPKLHSWQYHTVAAIRKYGALNVLSTETYETLHKYYVKNPYRLLNRKDVMHQLVNAVKRKDLTPSARKIIHHKAEGFGKILWELILDIID